MAVGHSFANAATLRARLGDTRRPEPTRGTPSWPPNNGGTAHNSAT
jgi:hypothetical protein